MTTTTNTLVKSLVKAVRTADRVHMHGILNVDSPTYTNNWTFVVKCQQYDKSVITFEVPGYVCNGNTSIKEEYEYNGRMYPAYSEVFKPTSGFWSFLGSQDRLLSALESVPNDAEIRFNVLLDSGTNEYQIKANLHTDYVYVCATWKRGNKTHERQFLIDTQCGEHNTARFGYSQ
jgi:hypothetical protein